VTLTDERAVPAERLRPPPHGAGRLPRRALLVWGGGALVLAVYAAVQLAFLLGPQPFDPAKYFKTAVDFPDVPADWWTLRIGLVAPVHAAVVALGPSEAALYAVPLAVGLTLAAAVYGTMLVLFRAPLPAAAAALVTVLNTHFLARSSSIFPDTAATATFSAGIFCLVLGARRAEERGGDRVATLFALCAGVLFGWTYLIREFSPVLLVAVVAAVVLLRYPTRRVAVVGGAALATAGLELLYGFLVYRDPLIHARVLLDLDERPLGARGAAINNFSGFLGDVVDSLLLFPRLLLTWETGWVFLLLLAVFVLALFHRRRDRRLWILAAWLFSFWVAMVAFGIGSLASGEWIVNVTSIRYWFPILPPLAMGAFAGVALLVPRRPLLGRVSLAHAATLGLAALALVPGLVEFHGCDAGNSWVNDPSARWHALRSWLATPEADRYDLVLADRETERLVPAFASSAFGYRLWDGRAEPFPEDGLPVVTADDLPSSLILVHKDRLDAAELERIAGLRNEWSPVFVSGDGQMVLLAHTSAPTGSASGAGQSWWLPAGSRSSAAPGTCGRPHVNDAG
jgi:hypothetical protein